MTTPFNARTEGVLGERPLIILMAGWRCVASYEYGWPKEADFFLEFVVVE